MNTKTIIPLGHISAAHGIKGEVLIKTYTEAPENIASYGPLSSEDGTRQITLKIVRITNKGVIARVEGVSDRNGAEALKGVKLCVPRDKLPAPDDDEWYYEDLIGLDVYDPIGRKLGSVANMHNFGAGDLMELNLAGAKSNELIAFNRDTVPNVDMVRERVTVILPEEFGDEQRGDKTPGDQLPSDESPSDESPSDESPSDESPSDESPSDESPSDESPSDESPSGRNQDDSE